MAEPARRATADGAIRVCAFDAYGTLFDVGAAARQAAERADGEALRDSWPRIAGIWRTRQLEYTWLRAVADAHADFWRVTQDALDWTLESEGLDGDPTLRQLLLDLYWELASYQEARGALESIRAIGRTVAILSNGTERMLEAAVRNAGIEDRVDAVLSVDRVGVFKPHRRVYDLVGAEFGCAPREVAFVSANGWDAAAGAGYGFRSIWVNREGAPLERLPWRPEATVADLAAMPALVRGMETAP